MQPTTITDLITIGCKEPARVANAANVMGAAVFSYAVRMSSQDFGSIVLCRDISRYIVIEQTFKRFSAGIYTPDDVWKAIMDARATTPFARVIACACGVPSQVAATIAIESKRQVETQNAKA